MKLVITQKPPLQILNIDITLGQKLDVDLIILG
jgi:hypothetical protein